MTMTLSRPEPGARDTVLDRPMNRRHAGRLAWGMAASAGTAFTAFTPASQGAPRQGVPAADASRALPAPWFVRALPSPASPPPAGAPPARPGPAQARLYQWPRAVLALVVKYQQNPLRAARALAYLQVALHDGWVLAARHWPASPAATHELVAHRAASLLAAQLYPHEAPGRFEAAFTALAGRLAPDAATRLAADALGRQVAGALVARSLADGSGRVWPPGRRPADFAGAWQPTWPLFAANPTEGMAPGWRPWVAPSPTRYDPPPPPRPGSERHARETAEVLATHRALGGEQRRLAQWWNLDAGSVTPAGVWMQIALRELGAPGDTPGDGAKAGRASAGARAHSQLAQADSELAQAHSELAQALGGPTALAVAMHDAFIDCWRVKLQHWSERPVTAVRRALDPAFAPTLVTPGFPGYVSGHATVSAAAAVVLAHFLPHREAALWAMAEQAAQSRLWGGIHFRGDNDEGLRLGRAVGLEVVQRAQTGAGGHRAGVTAR